MSQNSSESTTKKVTPSRVIETWIVNQGDIPAVVRVVGPDKKSDEVFIQPKSRARLPDGYTFNRTTLNRYPKVMVVTK